MMAAHAPGFRDAARVGLRVRGRVQGVGFRPFVYRLAQELSLGGWVRNDGAGVEIEVEGAAEHLARFRSRLRAELPPLARIERVDEEPREESCPAHGAVRAFAIVASRDSEIDTEIAPDAAVCQSCLDEIFDPRNRRYRYAFTNCTHCGPRYTITAGLPYDRSRTSMAGFPMCDPCAAEYRDAADRRFHAQPNACPRCGPRLSLVDAHGAAIADTDVVAGALERIRAGAIVAMKGLGGFHLVCDARSAATVARLRERKQREEKPLAVMVANRASLAGLAHCDDAEAALLAGVEAPIVLLRKETGCDAALAGIAPGIAWLGAMFPHAPLDWLLFHEAAGRPLGRAWRGARHQLVLVMTSANPRGDPLVTGNAEALERLAGIADAFVIHDRPILVRCDDSVMRIEERAPAFVRRARGYTPAPIALARDGPAVLAFGAHLKNALCVTRGAQAFVSQHVGDLDTAAARVGLEEAAEHLLRVLRVTPERVACDRHPDYFSSRLARGYAGRHGLPLVEVQHHHAHIAAIAAEHRLEGPLLGLALDGYGLGDDGEAWGGELLHVDGARCARVAHLRPLALPGGDRAAREPWRMAVAALSALGAQEVPQRVAPGEASAAASTAKSRPMQHLPQALLDALNGGLACATTSSAGRLFDAAAGLLGVMPVTSFEGQAAMLLEGLAERHGHAAPLANGYRLGKNGELDLLPLLEALTACEDAGAGAAMFHATLAAGFCEWTAEASARHGIARVALGGGCFLNRVLTRELRMRLAARGIETFAARAVPPNDGGLALGQAWVARQARGDAKEDPACA